MLELIRALEGKKQPTGIHNLWIKQKDTIERNSVRPFLEDIDSLPFPDRDMWQEWLMPNRDSRYGSGG